MIKKYLNNNLFLGSILILAFILRFWGLGEYPALNADEASIGYNAYSLLQTGRDEHSNPWPIHFQSFNDYKPGLYFYLSLPFIKILGLTEFAVRLPGASLGVLSILFIYLLTKELLKNTSLKHANLYSLAAGFLLAISPWHIHFSRGAWETNIGTFFIVVAVWLFLKAVNKQNSKFLFIASICFFVFSLYTYHSARITSPLLGMGLVVSYFSVIRKNLKSFLPSLVIGVVLSLPLIVDFLGPAGLSRASGVGLFSDPGPRSLVEEQRGEHINIEKKTVKLLHNKVVNYSFAFLQNWASHLNGEFLFLSGDEIQRNKVPETGQLYLFEIITIGVGILFLIRNTHQKPVKIILFWLLVSPIAASLTFQSPHALRAHNLVIPLTIISGFGLVETAVFLFHKLKRRKSVLLLTCSVLVLFVSWNVARYLQMYWLHMAKEYPFSSQYGLKELVGYLKNEADNKEVVITNRYDQPYILFLFYLKYPPQDFQKDHQLTAPDQYGFSTVENFGKYSFRNITGWDTLRETYKDALIVGTDEEIYPEANIIKEIYGSNGKLYFEIVAN